MKFDFIIRDKGESVSLPPPPPLSSLFVLLCSPFIVIFTALTISYSCVSLTSRFNLMTPLKKKKKKNNTHFRCITTGEAGVTKKVSRGEFYSLAFQLSHYLMNRGVEMS